jgi:hypothetical protein
MGKKQIPAVPIDTRMAVDLQINKDEHPWIWNNPKPNDFKYPIRIKSTKYSPLPINWAMNIEATVLYNAEPTDDLRVI